MVPPSIDLYIPLSSVGLYRFPSTAAYTILLLLGSITILGICLEFGRPEKVHVFPASTLLKTPYPDETFPLIVTSPPPT